MPILSRAIAIAGLICLAGSASSIHAQQGGPDDLPGAIEAVRGVAPGGGGHVAAAAAMKVLNAAGLEDIPRILDGMDGASPLAANWLRSAVNTIVASGGDLPIPQILAYFEDPDRSPLGRLLAFELVAQAQPDWAELVIPELVDDASLPLRYRGVQYWIDRADGAEPVASLGYLSHALQHARDSEQIVGISRQLAERGIEIDLQRQMGFLANWYLVGRFDNREEGGFDVVFGPEQNPAELDLGAEFKSLDGKPARWERHVTRDPTGIVDLNEVIGKFKGEIVYAATRFDLSEETPALLRIGCINAHKVWVNGELVMANEIYHNGMSIDKFTAEVTLRKGENVVLVKVCQNEQTESWAQDWQFQVRICDPAGKAISTDAPARPEQP